MEKSDLSLTYDKVMTAISAEASDFCRAIHERHYSAVNFPRAEAFIGALAAHTRVIQLESKIASIVRRYAMKCLRCEDVSVLGDWYLVDRGTLLKCPKCNQITPRQQGAETEGLEKLISLSCSTPSNLFAKER